jgi:hypothetical protein
MPSPFPSMDPYLEGDLWQEFHDTLAHEIRNQLLPHLQPNYVALLSKRYVFDRPALGVLDLPPEQRVIYPDAHIVHVKEVAPAYAGTMAPTLEVNSPMDEEVPVLSVEIRDVAQRRLVTVIEILSPVNKWGDGAREYVLRRHELLKTHTHLLEIDLIRCGGRIPFENPLPPAPYYVFLSRFDRRPVTEVWAISLRQALPTVPVPLLPPDKDVPLALQTAVDACFDLVGYVRLLDYNQPPPPPPFTAEDIERLNGRIATATNGKEPRIEQ